MHKPTDESRLKVGLLAAVGLTHKAIAKELGIGSDNTLRNHYREELDEGKSRANASVAKALYTAAMKGNITAQIFWLKCQAGWIEGAKLELSGSVAGLPAAGFDLKKLTFEDRMKLDEILAKAEQSSGAEPT